MHTFLPTDILPEKVLAKEYLASLNRTESDEDNP